MKPNSPLHFTSTRPWAQHFFQEFTTLLVLLVTSRSVHAQTVGSLDPAFNPSVTGSIRGTAVQADGKILLVGPFTAVNGQTRNGIARLNSDGSVESTATFNSGTGANWIRSVAVQTDGKILLGGEFSTVDGQTRNRIARLNPDGTLESTATFNPGTGGNNYSVFSVAVQADGKILLVGDFSSFNGQPRNRIARLNPDGTLESTATFNPGTGVAGDVRTVAVQADGKILLGGETRNRIARLNPDGTLESTATFNPGTGPDNYYVRSVAVQADGKILLGGAFTSVNGQPRNRIARLNPDGTLESTATFNPGTGANNVIYSVALQADGKILLVGLFTTVDGETRNGIARLNLDGTLESTATFNSGTGANDVVWSVAVQADGKILLGGGFDSVNGQPRNRVARLNNGAVSQSLTVPSNSCVQWLRGGSGPEVEQVSFEMSINGGVDWQALGTATRITGGWELTGMILPATGTIRARGRTTGGEYNGSSGIVEKVATFSDAEISVEQPDGVPLTDGTLAPLDFGPVASGNSASLTFTIRNTRGPANLTGIDVTKDSSGTPEDFTIGALGATTLAPDASTTVSVTFSPKAPGVRTATLQIASNDADENPFDINLTGSQATASEIWRLTNFGSPYNTGAGADLSDPDGDGIVNVLEYATATNPLMPTLFPGALAKNGNMLEFTYTRRKAAVAEMSFVREFSETLTGTWGIVGGTVETILSDDGVLQQVKTTVPAGSNGKRFVRLRVTRL